MFAEKRGVSNVHPHCNSRIYPRFLPEVEKSHETSPSVGDEAESPEFAASQEVGNKIP